MGRNFLKQKSKISFKSPGRGEIKNSLPSFERMQQSIENELPAGTMNRNIGSGKGIDPFVEPKLYGYENDSHFYFSFYRGPGRRFL